MTAMTDLARIILDLERRIEQLDRRVNNTVREARVIEVDPAKGLVKVEAHGLKSGWAPWTERAGAIRTWTPPAVGERVLLVSPTGEPGQGIVFAGGYSDQFKAPSENKDEHVLEVGDLKVTHNKEKTIIALKDGGKFVATKKISKLKWKKDLWLVLDGENTRIVASHPVIVADDPDPH